MSIFKPFKALHATEKYIVEFPSISIENFSKQEISKKINATTSSIIKMVAPTFKSKNTNYKNYEEVRNNFLEALKKEELEEDDNISYYIYQQINTSHQFTGILGLCDVNDIENNKIKIHENTLTSRVHQFSEYLSKVHIQSEPVLMAYPDNQKIELLQQQELKNKPAFLFIDEQNTQHKIWKVKHRSKLVNFKSAFEKLDALYIADGHHRLASTQHYAKQESKNNKNPLGLKPYNYILSLALPHSSLKIFEFNRLVKDLNGFTSQEFLGKLSEVFTVVEKEKKPYFPSHKHHISMYLEGKFYGLYIKHELRGTPKGLGELDTYLFEELLAKPILNIKDSTKDPRIDFLKGTGDLKGILDLKKQVDKGTYKVAFGFYPINFYDLKLIADLKLKMPPKSTYIMPKLLTGLLMYNMKK